MATRSWLLAGITVAVLASFAGPAGAASQDSWPMWQGDAAHSGYLPDTLLLAQRTFAWSKVARPGAITAMVASNTAVFTTDSPTYQYSAGSTATLGAQDLSDGHTLWSISFPSDTVISGPAYADGALFFVENIYQGFNDADTRFLTAVDATTGQQIYRVPLPLVGTTVDTPTISNGHVYLQSQVYPGSYSPSPYSFGSFAEASGSLEWQSESAGDGTLPTVIGDRIYGCLATLNILDAADGTTLGAVPNPDDTSDACTTKAPAVLGSMAYVNQGDRLAAFDLQAGTVAWSVDHYAAGQISTDGASLFYNSAGALTVRDAATGTLQWGWEAPLGSIGSSGALSDNMVVTKTHVILSDGNKLYFIDRNTHFLVGSYQVAGIVAFASNRVLVGDASGIVTAFHVPTEEIFASGFE